MTTSKKESAPPSPRHCACPSNAMPQKYKAWLIEYMKTYHPEAEIRLETDYFIAFNTELFKYDIAYYRQSDFAQFDLCPIEYGASIFSFPMPPTYNDFITIMKILDVK